MRSSLHDIKKEQFRGWIPVRNFLGTWQNYANVPWLPVMFCRDELGFTVLRGLIKNLSVVNSTENMFQLPHAYCVGEAPGTRKIFGVMGFMGTTGRVAIRVDVDWTGLVQYVPHLGSQTAAWISLTGIRFRGQPPRDGRVPPL